MTSIITYLVAVAADKRNAAFIAVVLSNIACGSTSLQVCILGGGAEFAGQENEGQRNFRGWKMQDSKLTDKSAAGQKCGINVNLQQLQLLALFSH